MIKKFKFDYDFDNDSLFLYNPKSKSKASIEMDDFIIDFNSKKEITAIEILNASEFFKGIDPEFTITKDLLKKIIDCNVEMIPKNNWFLIKFIIKFPMKKKLETPIMIPTINTPSPAIV